MIPIVKSQKYKEAAAATVSVMDRWGRRLGTVYLGQSLKFMAPVRPGDTVRAEVRVVDIEHPRRRVTLDCVCRVGDTTVLKGEALVLAPSKKFD